ncbi:MULTISPECIES: hypothetical protein [Rhodococcus]|uniref:hypothetical protein n=1 Tax=Rhodococcus TaxID=1827 RepID=UPI000932F4DC|nr:MULTISPECIES: hypothetical protein [Rhodococcus]MBP2214779.1 hypothetical protein [Rhodococcus ruber]NCL77150.1 hypothetical protein [Rhodococcus sp. YH1]NCL78842.1 hypothetical protein [Rhodococcus sp. YH1]WML60883.1 hypothetical protein QNA09_00565 [Rhodococcus sp. AH-ZY2]
MSRLHRSREIHAQNINRRRAAESAAGDLWRDVVFKRIEDRELADLDAADHRFQASLIEFDLEIDRILGTLDGH